MRLKAFFSYFGAKVSLAGKYPAPEYGTIIEPFAGSAGYSCSYWDRDIILWEKNPVLVGVWEYLIRATAGDIRSLPVSVDPSDIAGLSQPERDLIGFWWGRCIAEPAKKPGGWALSGLYPYSFWSPKTRERIALQVDKIKHWRCFSGSYSEIPNQAATWFVDPPYQLRGSRYPFGPSGIDYPHLATWTMERRGQVIACESDSADYLPIRAAYENSTVKYRRQKRTVTELIYTHNNPEGDPNQ